LDTASSLDGLSSSHEDAKYLVKYKNNLIGRQFKFIQQLGIFHLHRDMCSNVIFDLWKATGELGALLWFPLINNMEQYLVSKTVSGDLYSPCLLTVCSPGRSQGSDRKRS
jgi:hypothetical protein